MTTNYHTPIAAGAPADAATFNGPMSELDTQITAHNTEIVNARGSMASVDTRLDVSLNNNGTIKNNAVTAGTIAANAITAQSQINLGDAAAVAGDAVRYNEHSGHAHNITYWSFLYAQATESAAADTNAPATTIFTRTDNNNSKVIYIYATFYKEAAMDVVRLTGKKKNTSASLEGTITLGIGLTTTTEAVATASGPTDFKLDLDVSGKADNQSYIIIVEMHYAGGAGGATGQLELILANLLVSNVVISSVPI